MHAMVLEWLAAEVMEELPVRARGEVAEVLVEVARHPEWWPAPGGEETVDFFGPYCWASVVAYADGLEVRDVGWCG
ncbi:hypothetical protein JHN60_29345 [Streptomyces sp. MBT51]|nr:hypothetical protein [Streptomyces sp. MBT51]